MSFTVTCIPSLQICTVVLILKKKLKLDIFRYLKQGQ